MSIRILRLLPIILSFSVAQASAASESFVCDFFYEDQVKNNPEMLMAEARQYEHGEGVVRDQEKAVDLYCQAARQGAAEGQYALGWMYANGRGVERDDRIAAKLFEMAASQAYPQAQKMLQLILPLDGADVALPECLETSIDVFEDSWTGKYHVDQSVLMLVEKLAPQYELDPGLVLAVISIESGFNARAVSHKNAQGLMQLIPATAERFQVKNIFDPEENIKGGMAYLRWLLAFFRGDVALTVAAYNAGEGAVEKYGGIPPYPETVKYVDKIMSRYNRASHPYQPSIVSRSSFIFASAVQ